MNSNLFDRIDSLGQVTPSQQKIIYYLRKIKGNAALETIESISRGAGVSKASITRFIILLGYRGFIDFRRQMKTEMMSQLASPLDLYQLQRDKLQNDAELWDKLAESIVTDIQLAKAYNRSDVIEEAARILADCTGSVYIVGQVYSYTLAHHLWLSMLFLRPNVFFLDNHAGNLVHRLIDITDEDVLFAACRSPYARGAVTVMRRFAEKGAKIILMTGAEKTPISKMADIQLVAPVEWETILGSRCSSLALIEALSLYMARYLGNKIEARAKDFWRMALENDVYLSPQQPPTLFMEEEAAFPEDE